MRLGIPRETAKGEQRVAMTPEVTAKLAKLGHDLIIEPGAGKAAGFADAALPEPRGRTVSSPATAIIIPSIESKVSIETSMPKWSRTSFATAKQMPITSSHIRVDCLRFWSMVVSFSPDLYIHD